MDKKEIRVDDYCLTGGDLEKLDAAVSDCAVSSDEKIRMLAFLLWIYGTDCQNEKNAADREQLQTYLEEHPLRGKCRTLSAIVNMLTILANMLTIAKWLNRFIQIYPLIRNDRKNLEKIIPEVPICVPEHSGGTILRHPGICPFPFLRLFFLSGKYIIFLIDMIFMHERIAEYRQHVDDADFSRGG